MTPTSINEATQTDLRRHFWTTDAVQPDERFAYYREAICKAFMDLTPEPPAIKPFDAQIESVRMGEAAINRVLFPRHRVTRVAADIAASEKSCFYLNLKRRGRCTIAQNGRVITLSPGQVGIFDSERLFTIDHDATPTLQVASFWVPQQALRDRLPPGFDLLPTRLSDNPVVGGLIVETARTLNETALAVSETDCLRLFDILLDLVAFAVTRNADEQTGAATRAATGLVLRRLVNERLTRPRLSPRSVARALGISTRYVHRLFEKSGTTFSRYVIERRLDGIAADLRDGNKSARPIGEIAFDWGFVDLSHFSRAFRRRFDCTPSEWRRQR